MVRRPSFRRTTWRSRLGRRALTVGEEALASRERELEWRMSLADPTAANAATANQCVAAAKRETKEEQVAAARLQG